MTLQAGEIWPFYDFFVFACKYFAALWTQQLSTNMLQNCTEHVKLVDIKIYSTFWSTPFSCLNWQIHDRKGFCEGRFLPILACYSHLFTDIPENWSKSWIKAMWFIYWFYLFCAIYKYIVNVVNKYIWLIIVESTVAHTESWLFSHQLSDGLLSALSSAGNQPSEINKVNWWNKF